MEWGTQHQLWGWLQMTAMKWIVWTSRVISYTLGMGTCGIQGAKDLRSWPAMARLDVHVQWLL